MIDFTRDAHILRKEEQISQMSNTEKEIFFVREDYYAQKIDREQYEDAVDCTLFWAEQDGKVTAEESKRLYDKYVA